jgi:hypothetical protein
LSAGRRKRSERAKRQQAAWERDAREDARTLQRAYSQQQREYWDAYHRDGGGHSD